VAFQSGACGALFRRPSLLVSAAPYPPLDGELLKLRHGIDLLPTLRWCDHNSIRKTLMPAGGRIWTCGSVFAMPHKFIITLAWSACEEDGTPLHRPFVLLRFTSAISISRLIASGRDGLSFCELAHPSTLANWSGSNVKWIEVGSFLGRPRLLFSVLIIDCLRLIC
jgi:hypothetical protein